MIKKFAIALQSDWMKRGGENFTCVHSCLKCRVSWSGLKKDLGNIYECVFQRLHTVVNLKSKHCGKYTCAFIHFKFGLGV